jgi:hypothetical protein
VFVPAALSDLHGPRTGPVQLPLQVYSSGHGPRRVFNLDDEAERRELYELVLTEGELEDVVRYLNPQELLRLWPGLWIPEHVRSAWRPLLVPAA